MMRDVKQKTVPDTKEPAQTSAGEARKKRLAGQLRQNLRNRKAQARLRRNLANPK